MNENQNQNANAQANANVGTQPTAQPQANNVGNAQNTNANYDEIFNKLDSIVAKRMEGITKSALKDNGYEDAEMKDILSQYRASKEAKNQEAANQLSALQTENAQLKATMREKDLNNEALTQARSLDVDDKTVPYLIKLADLNNCIDDKGNVDGAKVKTALEKVLSDVPNLKKAKEGTTGVTVGADTSNQGTPSGNLFGFNFTGVRKQ